MSEQTRWQYDEVVAEMRAGGFRPMLLVFARARRDVHPDASEFSFSFPSTFTEAEKDVTMEAIKRALFEQFIRGRFNEAEAERLRRLARHRDN